MIELFLEVMVERLEIIVAFGKMLGMPGVVAHNFHQSLVQFFINTLRTSPFFVLI